MDHPEKKIVLIKYFKLIVINLIVLVLLIVFLQLLLSAAGEKPYSETQKAQISTDSDKPFFQKDSLLGYKHCTGDFEVHLKEGFTFVANHTNHAFRKTSKLETVDSIQRPEIWLLGCSFTYGWSLHDEETFAWCLQSKLEDFKVINMGVSGYGTIHFYLQLKSALKNKKTKPVIVILNHADFHHERNINTYNYNRSISTWNNFGKIKRPFVETEDYKKLKIDYLENSYTPWAISRKYALAKWTQFRVEQFLDGRKFKTSKKITAHLLDEIKQLCLENNIQLLITNVGLKKEFIQNYTYKNNVSFVDVAVDYHEAKYNNLPFDKHPSAAAHQVYCTRIYEYLQSSQKYIAPITLKKWN